MDGFDDLLASSSRALEANPFEDPFAHPRSNSPDPWASFGQPSASQYPVEGFGEPELAASPFATETTHSDLTNGDSPAPQHAVDPVAIHLEPEELTESPVDTPHTLPTPQSPGFRESISTNESAVSHVHHEAASTAESTPPSSVEQTRAPSPDVTHKTPTQSPVLEPAARRSPSPSSSIPTFTLPSTPPIASGAPFINPLDHPSSHRGISQSFASLALGGESVGGWQDQEPEMSFSTNEADGKDDVDEASISANSISQQSSRVDPSGQPLFVIAVDDPQKVGDPIRPYILYTVHTKTTSSMFSKSSFSVLRRYSDFLWLYETLSANNPGVFVPPVPEKSPFGRFEDQFVNQRRLALEKCIQKIANHPVLSKDTDLRLFLESDSFSLDIKHRKTEIAQERGGLMSSIGQTIAGPRFYEVDDWFDKKKTYLDSLESQLRGLVKAVDAVSKQRAELAVATGEFSLAIGELSASELSKQLSHSLAVMSDVEKRAQDLQHAQAQEDAMTFMSTAEEYTRIINSVRMAFASRVRCHAQWQSAEGELRRVKQVHERARSQGKIPQDRIGHSLAQIADAERRALEAKHEFERCSRLIKTEMIRFDDERIGDFKISMDAFLEGMISRQKELIASWESYQELLLKKVNAVQRPLNQESRQSSILSG